VFLLGKQISYPSQPEDQLCINAHDVKKTRGERLLARILRLGWGKTKDFDLKNKFINVNKS